MSLENIFESRAKITREEREGAQGGAGITFWLTGLSGSGKSTLSREVEKIFFERGYLITNIDGDNLRKGLCSDLGFSSEERFENIRRAAEVAKILNDNGFMVISSLISPFREHRELARRIIGENHFFEVYINSSLALCEKRDPKGLYKKARENLIKDFTGISSPYEPPQGPCLMIETGEQGLQESVTEFTRKIESILASRSRTQEEVRDHF